MRPTDSNYIDTKVFTELLMSWQVSRDEALLDRLIRDYFYPLAHGIIRKRRMRLVDPEDAIQEMVTVCVLRAPKFNPHHATKNPNSSNIPHRKAFSFFTAVAMNCYKGLYRAELTQVKGKQQAIVRAVEDHLRDFPSANKANSPFRQIHDEIGSREE